MWLLALLLPMILLFLAFVLITASWSGPGWRGPPSDHFDGRRFRSRVPSPRPLRELLPRIFGRRGAWPAWVDVTPTVPPPAAKARVTFVNHATVLLQLDGVNLLTDPVWSARCSPWRNFGPARHQPPGVRLEELPKIHGILLSHDHYDHLDLDTLRWLARVHRPVIVTGLGVGALLRREGFTCEIRELDWGQSCAVEGLTVHVVEGRHFSGRGLLDRDRTLWIGHVVQAPSATVYFAGDTAYGPHFADIGARFPIDLALLPIGAYLPRAWMAPVHLDPADAAQAHLDLRARASLAIHYGTFRLSAEAFDQPVADLAAACARLGVTGFRCLAHGEGWELG